MKLTLQVFLYIGRQKNTVKYGFILNGKIVIQVNFTKCAQETLTLFCVYFISQLRGWIVAPSWKAVFRHESGRIWGLWDSEWDLEAKVVEKNTRESSSSKVWGKPGLEMPSDAWKKMPSLTLLVLDLLSRIKFCWRLPANESLRSSF